jgi:cyclophilin family peptidyl-prolyl cis-trans isomerase
MQLFTMFALLALFPQADSWKSKDGLYAEVLTNKGPIVMQLEFQKTPVAAANFVGLAEGTIKNTALAEGRPYFDGSKWHRVVPGHVIQTGIPANGKSQGPGYQFPNEIRLPELNHDSAGMVNMANSGPHTNGSQWCIMLGDRSYLDGDYTVFGRVVQGMDVVFSIIQGDEIKSVKIVRVGAEANRFHPTTESFQKMVEEAKARAAQEDQKKKAAIEQAIRANWPQAKSAENGIQYVMVREGSGEAPVAGTKMKIAYTGKTLGGTNGEISFASTAGGGRPYFGDKGTPFDFEVGKTPAQVNRGLDAMVAQMKKGERRTLIIPGAQGYGAGGYYEKEVPGRKRFHISPNTTLIYEVDILDIMK